MPDFQLNLSGLDKNNLKQLIVMAAIVKHPSAGESIAIEHFVVRTPDELRADIERWRDLLWRADLQIINLIALHVPREVLQKVLCDDAAG